METKVCTKCGIEKEIIKYNLKPGGRNGLNSWCKECIMEYNKQYRINNVKKKKEWNIKNKDKIAEQSKRWQQNHKENMRERWHKRESLKKSLPATLTQIEWEIIKNKFNNLCAYCGEEKSLTQDHFIALSKGGGYTLENIIPACQSCNSSKKNITFKDWYVKQNFYSIEREKFIMEIQSDRRF